MNVPSTTCPRCGTRRSAQDLASGAAVARNGTIFCTRCAPVSPNSERRTVEGTLPRPAPVRVASSGWASPSPSPPSPTPPSARLPTVATPTPPSARLAALQSTHSGTPEPSPSPDSTSARSSSRRSRAVLRPAPAPRNQPLPFPWRLALAGVLTACLSTFVLTAALRAPPPSPPPGPPPPPDPVPAAGAGPRELADTAIRRARACEAQGDLESACLALELPPSSPVLADSACADLVRSERDRLERLRDGARAHAGGREPPSSGRGGAVARALKTAGVASEAELATKRSAIRAASAALLAEIGKARVAHGCYVDPKQRLVGIESRDGLLEHVAIASLPVHDRLPMIFDQEGQSRLTCIARADPVRPRRVVIALHATAQATGEVADARVGLLGISINGGPVTAVLVVENDATRPTALDVTGSWTEGENRIVVTYAEGPSRVAVETVEVLEVN